MKTVTVVIHNEEVSALDMPEGIQLRIVNTYDPSVPTELENGKVATVTTLVSDNDLLNELHSNGKTIDGLPQRPDLAYADQWQGWADWFGWVPKKRGGHGHE